MEQAENDVIQNEVGQPGQETEQKPVSGLGDAWEEVSPEQSIGSDAIELDVTDDSNSESDEQNGEVDEVEDGEDEFYFGDEKLESLTSAEEKDPALVKNLRSVIKQKEKELRELRHASTAVAQPVSLDLPPEPTMESVDYDEEDFKTKWREWNDKKLQVEGVKKQQEAQQEEYVKLHNDKLAKYTDAKRDVKFKDYHLAEQAVIDEIPVRYQNAIIDYSSNPTLVVMALGRSAQLRNELANAKDPIALGRLLERIETKAKALPKGKKAATITPDIKSQGGVQRRTSADIALSKVLPDAVFK